MNLRSYLFPVFFLFPVLCSAQAPVQLNAAQIEQGLSALQVSGSVLYIAAHPDDENTRLLAYLAGERRVRTGYLSMTRGDGGQNLIGPEQGELLGLIRTQELLAARHIDGAVQFFTRANDFGFSKNSAETFKIWDKDKILADVVWVIRQFRPDVIITRFPEDARAGHGHHAASAILAREAFSAAADPARFPEQLRYVKTWQARRILWNTFNFGSTNTTASDQLQLDAGGYNPLLGKSYGEIAAESRSSHKSQGFGTAGQRGTAIEFFSPVAGEPAVKDLFDGIDLTLNRDQGTAAAQRLLSSILKNYRPAAPSLSVPALLQLKAAVKDIPFKHQQLDELILACSGIRLEATVGQPSYAVDETIPVNLNAVSRVGTDFPVNITISTAGHAAQPLLPGHPLDISLQLSAGSIGLTQPYWLKADHPTGRYVIDSLSHLGFPEAPAPDAGPVTLSFNGQLLQLRLPVRYKHTDPVKGELYEPLVIAPPVTATMAEKAYVFSNNTPKAITVQLRSFAPDQAGDLVPELPEGWTCSPAKYSFRLKQKGDEQTVSFVVSPAGKISGGNLSLSVQLNGKTYGQALKVIDYPHIPVQTLFPAAAARLERADLKFAGKNIGYIAGAGDLIPEALQQIGYQVTRLSPEQVLHNDLSGYDALVTGVRLYNISGQAALMQPRLMEYVRGGGNLLVQYNVNTPLKIADIGPYPFSLSRDRVTEEDAEVKLLSPDDPALNYPNKIGQQDFSGWIQERGLYFATGLDSRYTPLLQMHDTGEPDSSGSLFTAFYGKGRFVYTSLAFFRELPAGVPGAYRLFVNLLSNPARQ